MVVPASSPSLTSADRAALAKVTGLLNQGVADRTLLAELSAFVGMRRMNRRYSASTARALLELHGCSNGLLEYLDTLHPVLRKVVAANNDATEAKKDLVAITRMIKRRTRPPRVGKLVDKKTLACARLREFTVARWRVASTISGAIHPVPSDITSDQ